MSKRKRPERICTACGATFKGTTLQCEPCQAYEQALAVREHDVRLRYRVSVR